MGIRSSGVRVLAVAGVVFALSLQSFAAEPPRFVKMVVLPEQVVLGEQTTIFFQATSQYSSPDEVQLVIGAQVDGVPVTLLHPAADLWVAQVGPYSQVGSHEVVVTAAIEDKDDADEVRQGISRLNQDIATIDDQIRNEIDPDVIAQLNATRAGKIIERTQLETTLAGLKTNLGADEFTFAVETNTDVRALRRNIILAQNRAIVIQNNDGGWDYSVPPESAENTGNASISNQFGINALGLVSSYGVTWQPTALASIRKTITALLARPIQRKTRLFTHDAIFLQLAYEIYGFASFTNKAQAHYRADKEYLAAIHVLDHPDPTDAQVNAIPQATLDAVTDVQRVAALKRRILHLNRLPGLRAFDTEPRIWLALLMNDTSFALALADYLVENITNMVPTDYYYLQGLGKTLSGLARVRHLSTNYDTAITQVLNTSLSWQRSDGRFWVPASAGAEQGYLQDQAYFGEALLMLGRVNELAAMLAHMYPQQSPSGAFIEGGIYEFPTSESDYLLMLTQVWQSQIGNSVFEGIKSILANVSMLKNMRLFDEPEAPNPFADPEHGPWPAQDVL